MDFPMKVVRSFARPSFNNVRDCFEEYRNEKGPCKGGVDNQCAVRMSVALVRSGLGLDRFQTPSRIHNARRSCRLAIPHVIGAEELEKYLRTALGKPLEFSYRDMSRPDLVMQCLRGSTGITYFNNIFKRHGQSTAKGDHIDLFDGQRCYNEILGITPGGSTSSATMSFFDRADRVSFFYLA